MLSDPTTVISQSVVGAADSCNNCGFMIHADKLSKASKECHHHFGSVLAFEVTPKCYEMVDFVGLALIFN
jgi:hypothetical protein